MTGEPPLTQQQRAVVELYVRSKWIKASLALEDENLFIEYAHNKHEQATPAPASSSTIPTTNSNEENNPNNGSTSNDTPDTITSQKRIVKIVKPDNTGLGRKVFLEHFTDLIFFFHFAQASASKVDEKIACRS
jgi:hypothetical protein